MAMPLQIQVLIQKKAAEHRVDPVFLLAIVLTESSGNPDAVRHEEKTAKYLVDPSRYAKLAGIPEADERIQQMTSWGLMQVMGYVARELGFKGRLGELCEKPELGLIFGIYKLKHLEVMYAGRVEMVMGWCEPIVAAYNHGHPHKLPDGTWFNQAYVDKVKAAYLAHGGQI